MHRRDRSPASPARASHHSGAPHPAYSNSGSNHGHSYSHGYGHGHSHSPYGHPTYQRSPLASPSTYQPSSSSYGLYGASSGSRHSPAAHQLQHPDHAISGGRGSPFSSPQTKSFQARTGSQRSSPEPGHAASAQRQQLTHTSGMTPHSSSSAAGAAMPASPLTNVADLSDVSAAGVSGGRSAKPPAKKRKTDPAEQPDSRENSVDGKDGKSSGRVAKACTPCSTKKRRCDGRQPECSVCQVLGTTCTYNHTGLKRGPPKGFRSGPKESAKAKLVRSLETTIRDLINHLGKEEAGSEILRVTSNREMGLSKEEDESRQHDSSNEGKAGASVPFAPVKEEKRDPISRGSRTKGSGEGGEERGEPSDASDEDVIGDTRMGELVYRGSSSGIGILQRQQHRADSPAPPQGAAPGLTRGRLDTPSQRIGGRTTSRSRQVHPVFVPIASPRTAGSHQSAGGETPTSSHARSPVVPRRGSPKTATDGGEAAAVGAVAANADPVVSINEHSRLFRYYWQGFHPFWPLLFKPYVTSLPVEQLRHELEPCLLYSIYAIAACIVPGNRNAPSTNEQRSLHDHDRAQLFSDAAERHLFAKGLRPDIPTIQSCWLLCLYSHGVGDLSRAWNMQNLASSMAVDLGLHRWPIYRSEVVDDVLSRETRIRLIWHVYIMDKVLCAEMGRPVGLRAKDCDVPLLSETAEDEFELWSEQTEMLAPGPQPISTGAGRNDAAARHLHAPSCLNWGIHLFKIVEHILDQVHSLRRKALLRKQGKSKMLAELDKELADWQAKLPKHLHLDQETRDGPLPSFFALNLWYYTATLLLHRPFIPQEEGLSLAEVVSNESHRKSTEAANTICDLLEKSSTDFVDRLSTDLGYCLFTAAVMFVFNARLPDEKISSDARRRYGLCRKWLKKLADTWPAASAQKLLLDGFALVGEDASKSGETPARRPSIATLGMIQQQQQNGGAEAASADGVTAWIAETDAATRQPSPAQDGPTPRLQGDVTGAAQGSGKVAQPSNAGALGQSGAAPVTTTQPVPSSASMPQQLLAQPSQPSAMQQQHQPPFAAAELNFAPGIFDVESFFWNENIAINAPFMQQTMGAYPYSAPGQQQAQSAATAPYSAFFANPQHPQPQQQDRAGLNGGPTASTAGAGVGGVGVATSQPTDGLSMLAQVTSSSQLGANQGQAAGSFDSRQLGSYTGFGLLPGGGGGERQQAQTSDGRTPVTTTPHHTGMTPYVYPVDAAAGNAAAAAAGTHGVPTNAAMGEFWSMLELPPTFL